MAGRYRKIETRIWNDAKFQSLSERGKLVFLFLLTHPNLTMLGAMRATVPGLAAELRVDFEGFREGFREGCRKGMVKHDAEASFVWMPNFLRYNKPESPNVVKSWPGVWELLPECSLKFELAQRVRDLVKGLTKGFHEAFAEAFPKGWPNQEQEQEQEQEEKPSAANASVTDDGSEPVSICNKLKEIGTGRTREKEGISAQHPVEIIPPQCSPEIVPPHATLLENLPPQTAQVSPEIIPSDEAAILETPDGLHPNQYATRLLEEIRFPVVPDRVHAVAAAIEREAKTMGLVGAYGFLVERTKFAIFEEHEINTSFFSESRYRPEQRNDNGRQVSTQAKRTSNTQRNDAFADDSNPDSRHAPIRELVQQMHLKKFRVKCQWDGSEGKALDRLLSANPSWSEEELARMVSNRFDSEGIAPDRPRKWLSNLGSYAAGAQDRYNKLKGSGTNGNGKPSVGQIVEREIAILHARRAQ